VIILKDCWAAGCRQPTTHVLVIEVLDTAIGPLVNEIGYCHSDARGFAYTLVENYTNQFKILDIRPVSGDERKVWEEDGETL